MADVASQLINLSVEKLNAIHERLHKSEASPAVLEVHHLALNEMARRKIALPTDDEWSKFEIQVDAMENADLTLLSSSLPQDLIDDVVKTTGSAYADVTMVLTTTGYEMRLNPRIEDVEKFNQNHDPANGRFSDGTSVGVGDSAGAIGKVGSKTWSNSISSSLNSGGEPSVNGKDVGALLHDMGKRSDDPDVTNLKIKGTLLFGGEGLGILRKDMPQIPAKMRKQYISDMAKEGITVSQDKVNPLTLKPSQSEISGKKTGLLYDEFKHTGIPQNKAILISKDNFVVDGHHHWAAAVGMNLAGHEAKLPVLRLSVNIHEALKASLAWSNANGVEAQTITSGVADFKKDLGWEFISKFNPNHDNLGQFATNNVIPAMADDVAPKKMYNEGVVAEAEALRAKSVAVEPVVTSEIVKLADSLGTKMVGLEQRLKSTDSLARKISDDANLKGDVKKASGEISDAIRYTMLASEKNYVGDVARAVQQFKTDGYMPKVKNFWQKGDPYQGINIKLSKNGNLIELQIHTAQSFHAKEHIIHPVYEKYRTEVNNRTRKTLYNNMREVAGRIRLPDNYSTLLGMGTPVFQKFQTAREAGLVKAFENPLSIRYFVKIDEMVDDPIPYALFRLDNNDVEQTLTEEQWCDGKWIPSSDVGGVLFMGDCSLEEVPAELAQEFFPDAFDPTMAKSVGKYEISNMESPRRYTLGAMYIPNRYDAHNEWTDGEELQSAVWQYVRSNDRRIRLQHNKDIVAGEWVEIMSFPYELTVPVQLPDGTTEQRTYPADTVFLGVVWEPWAWELVKTGKILGYSIGGRAKRLYVDMDAPVQKDDAGGSDGPTVNSVHVDSVMGSKKKKKAEPKIEVETDEIVKVAPLTADDVSTIVAEALKSFSPTIQVVLPDNKPKNRTIVRDEHGFITGMVEE